MTLAYLSRHLGAGLVAAAALACAACNSDDREQMTESTTADTTIGGTTEIPTWTEGEPSETTSTTTDTGNYPKTCRSGIFCAVQCVTKIPNPTPPEYDWQSCFFDNCLETLSAEEWLLLFDLVECAVEYCSQDPNCIEGNDAECQKCYLVTIGTPKLEPGHLCEAQAKACD
ncbi:MAG TPA: hypothetical protein VIK91_02190 [Nannocystis sp.]